MIFLEGGIELVKNKHLYEEQNQGLESTPHPINALLLTNPISIYFCLFCHKACTKKTHDILLRKWTGSLCRAGCFAITALTSQPFRPGTSVYMITNIINNRDPSLRRP